MALISVTLDGEQVSCGHLLLWPEPGMTPGNCSPGSFDCSPTPDVLGAGEAAWGPQVTPGIANAKRGQAQSGGHYELNTRQYFQAMRIPPSLLLIFPLLVDTWT